MGNDLKGGDISQLVGGARVTKDIVIGVNEVVSLGTPSIASMSAPTISNGSSISLTGSSFGTKISNQAAPILFDHVNEAYENGVLNTHQSSFTDGQKIALLATDPQSLWAGGTVDGSLGAGLAPKLTKSLPGRGPNDLAHYVMNGIDSNLGWPTAYGGHSTPPGNKKLYVAWYLKVKYDTRYYWAIPQTTLTGTFIPGEPITTGSGITGTFLGISSRTTGNVANKLEFIFDGQDLSKTSNLKGQTITGSNSGATVVFPTNSDTSSNPGYVTPGTDKYIRVWDNPDGVSGLRFSWSQWEITGVDNSAGNKTYAGYLSAPVTPGSWHLMEFEYNGNTNQIKLSTDGQLLITLDTSLSIPDPNYSPSIALLGSNGQVEDFEVTEVDDIYMDNSFARVALSNQSSFANITHYELQQTTSWSNTSINFDMFVGALNTSNPIYAYVINEDGKVNSAGYQL